MVCILSTNYNHIDKQTVSVNWIRINLSLYNKYEVKPSSEEKGIFGIFRKTVLKSNKTVGYSQENNNSKENLNKLKKYEYQSLPSLFIKASISRRY